LAGRGHRVIATESGSGPAGRASERLAGPVELRRGPGLQVVAPGEAEVAILAGMGGRRILEILTASPGVVASLHVLVLQPMQHLAELRAGLAGMGLDVAAEVEQEERGRRYTVLVVKGNGPG
jgi:tRNA (adenine22-N1)-methyltransferase